MKTPLAFFAIAALAAGLTAPVMAADKMARMAHDSMSAAPADAVLTDGLVKKVDKAGGTLTVAHGPLPNGMPGMTMAFRVKDLAWLGKIKDGQKIRFAIDDTMTISRLETVQ
jgi:Cu/Ag efflux protein CusF